MSRNFELLKRAEQDRQIRPIAGVETLDSARPLRPLPSEERRSVPASPMDATHPGIVDSAAPEISKLVQNLFVLPAIAAPRVVVFSPMVRSAKPDFISAQVAEALIDQRLGTVLVADCDVHRPSLHAYFDIPFAPGFTDVLKSQEPVQLFAHGVAGTALTVLTAGMATRDWQHLLAGDVMTERLRAFRSHFDFVVINTPPVSECPSVVTLGQRSDGVVLVIEANDTKRDVAVRVKQQWERANTRLLGAVLNNRTFPIPDRLYARL